MRHVAIAALVLCAGLAAPAFGSDVFYVGDSLGLDTTPFVRQDLSGFTVRGDSRNGRGSGEGVSVLGAGLRADDQVVVFDLGTNDDPDRPAVLAANLARAAKVAGQRCMVVATINMPAVNGVGPQGLNRAVSDFADGHPRVQVVDWHNVARPQLLDRDGIHTTPTGAKVRGRLFASAAQHCIDGYAGTGPVAPEPDLAGGSGAAGGAGSGGSAGPAVPAPRAPASKSKGSRPRAGSVPAAPRPALFGLVGRLAATTPGKWVAAGLATLGRGVSGAETATGPEPVLGAE